MKTEYVIDAYSQEAGTYRPDVVLLSPGTHHPLTYSAA